MTPRNAIAFPAAALLGAAAFICGCAPHPSLDTAIARADHDAWERAAPGTLAVLRSEGGSVKIVSLGAPGEVGFMTAYATPRVQASRSRAKEFVHPLHRAPDGGISATRREIREGGLLSGHELCWLKSSLEAYLVQVNGSAVVAWVDGAGAETGGESVIAWSASNGHEYASLGRLAIDAGLASNEEMSLGRLRALHTNRPERIEALMLENPRYIMFRELEPTESLLGSRARPLIAGVSLAADPRHPTDRVLLVEPTDGSEPFLGLVHDGGAAIVGPQRIDRYLGVGHEAMSEAGEVAQPVRVYLIEIDTAGEG